MSNNTTITTFTGKKVDLLNIKVEDIVLEDIAKSLSSIRRYAGHSNIHETVADHSIYMAKHFISKGEYKLALHALLHDATEAYTNDVVAPLKNIIPAIREFEETRIYPFIAERFGLEKKLPEEVKKLDSDIVLIEKNNFFHAGRDINIPVIPTYGDEGKYVFMDLYEKIVKNL